MVIAGGLGCAAGYLAASQRGRPLDSATIVATLVGVAVPVSSSLLLKAVFASIGLAAAVRASSIG